MVALVLKVVEPLAMVLMVAFVAQVVVQVLLTVVA
jgi:hypothetical protein